MSRDCHVDKEPVSDLIPGIATLAKFGTIWDFQDKTIQIDHAKISMRPLSSLGVKSKMCVEAFQTDNMYVTSGTYTGTSSFAHDHL